MLLQEIATRIIIPPLKGIISHELSEKGFSQRRISRLLEITQPQVHKYLSKPKDHYYRLLISYGFDPNKIKHYLDIILYTALKEDKTKLMFLMSSIVNDLAVEYMCRSKGYLGDYCSNKSIIDPYIEYYRSFVSMILSKYDLTPLIPEVGSNIVFAPENPKNIHDIIGLSGRIIKIGNSVKAVGEPIYGGSRHLSRVLLTIMKYNNRIRVAMNIRYSNEIIDTISKKGYKVVYTGPHESTNDFWLSIKESASKKPDIICDKGGYSLEP
ncbi:MAG: Fis family transcriptional regulator, partial [Staphylothermus sp.]|nr:Fis family transcriptional regulator [Staphylothermus sp.]